MTAPRLLLVLDDDRERLRGFEEIVSRLGAEWAVRTWRDAPSMIAELDRHLPDARLISLDHDLYKDSPSEADPGTGRQVAERLATRKPPCPAIVHSTNTDAAWGMHNVMRRAGWTVELVHHLNQPDWIEQRWLPVAQRLSSPPAQPTPPARGEALTLAEYRALARELPVPTPRQVRQFAEYVAGAHSWYKHLPPLPAKTPIQIYLDPGAGMQLVQGAHGVRAEVRDKTGFHYSWLPTAVHHERFGHLAFSKSSGTSVSLQSRDGSRLRPSDDAPGVYSAATGAFRQLPEEALMAGRAFISGIVHKLGSWRWLWESVINEVDWSGEFLERVDGLEVAKRILDRCAELKRNPACAEPAPPRNEHDESIATLDAPLGRLIDAERERQIEGLAAAATRVIRLARI